MDNSTINKNITIDGQNSIERNQANNFNKNNDAELSAEQQRLTDLCARERALEIAQKDFEFKRLKSKSFDLLSENGFKKDYHEMLSEFINYDSEEKCVESIEKLTIVINSLLEPLINDRLRGTNIPRTSSKIAKGPVKTNATFSDAVKVIKNKFNQ
ncbi:hypothetical protein [uncultured Clostridium sp.]|uniref:hypothetical protein n=1 Tax=uncultured Clostridium sp. TaxID=59620 RepID=UPI00261720F6|nr:hypothetical protein [uncultured Clostridium sp.]